MRHLPSFKKLKLIRNRHIIGFIMLGIGLSLLLGPVPKLSAGEYIQASFHIPVRIYSTVLIACGLFLLTIGQMMPSMYFVITTPFLFYASCVLGAALFYRQPLNGFAVYVGVYVVILRDIARKVYDRNRVD